MKLNATLKNESDYVKKYITNICKILSNYKELFRKKQIFMIQYFGNKLSKEKRMKTLKGGCILFNKLNGCVALVYRDKQNDFSFPKGHLEKGETIEECAIRETAEETKRVAEIVRSFEPVIDDYITPKGEHCVCYMYVALDKGVSDNTSLDTHDTYWIPFEQVEDKLSYDSLKKVWNSVKDKIKSDLF